MGKIEAEKKVWTIGHSTHPIDIFISMLQSFSIKSLIDIRHYPGSRKFPQYNKDELKNSLSENGIEYIHLVNLGGRRKPDPGSKNTAWRLAAFRGYADYMETDDFKSAAAELQQIATSDNTAYMCSEAVWWSCHRSLLSDYLKIRGWKVMHIMAVNKATEHPYTSAAKIIDGKLNYENNDLFSNEQV